MNDFLRGRFSRTLPALLAISVACGCQDRAGCSGDQLPVEPLCDGKHQRKCMRELIRVLEDYLSSKDRSVFAGLNQYVKNGRNVPRANEELRFQEEMLIVFGLLLQGRKPVYPAKEHKIVAEFVLPSIKETKRLQELLLVLSHKKTGPDGKPAGGDYSTAYQQIMGGFFTLEPDLNKHLNNSGIVKFTPGMVIADIGCGVGSQVVALAGRVGPSGRVYAVDISQRVVDFLTHLRTSVPGGDRIYPVRSRRDDTTLKPGSLDLAMVHGINFLFGGTGDTMPEHARGFFRSVRRALKPGGLFLIRSYQHTKKLEAFVASHGFETLKRFNAQPKPAATNNTMLVEDFFVLFKAVPRSQ